MSPVDCPAIARYPSSNTVPKAIEPAVAPIIEPATVPGAINGAAAPAVVTIPIAARDSLSRYAPSLLTAP